MNFSGFKKQFEDKKTAIMAHPNGHSITVFKDKLSAMQRKQLEKLPIHLAAGGLDSPDDSEGDDSPPSDAPASNSFNNSMASLSNSAQQLGQNLKPLVVGSNPDVSFQDILKKNAALENEDDAPVNNTEIPPANKDIPTSEISNQPAPAPDAQNAVAANQAVGANIQGAFKLGQTAIREQQNVAEQLAKSQADIEQHDVNARAAFNQNVAQTTNDYKEHQQQLLQDYMDGHINASHYQENMGTGQKVATAIGLILGGLGGGLNRTGVNPAAEWLNKQIDRDIEAQKSRQGQQKTLLEANRQLYQDETVAQNATRANMNDIYNHQLQLAATKLGTPQAKAIADQQSAKFSLDNANLLQTNAVRSSVNKSLQNGGLGVDPIALGNAQYMKPEEAQKEQSSVNAQKAAISRIGQLYADLDKEQSTANLLNPQSYARANTIKAGIIDAALATDVNHRINPDTYKKLLEPYVYGTGATDKTRATDQYELLQKIKQQTAADTPITSRIAPRAIPQYPTANTPAAVQSKPGDTVYVNGVKGQVLPDGKIRKVK